MEENRFSVEWRFLGESVKGASHIRSELPNQDALKLYPDSGIGPPVILTISDGHGNAKSFRSHQGSLIAVETATRVIRQEFFFEGQSTNVYPPKLSNKDVAKHTIEVAQHIDVVKRLLPQRIVNEWREAVDENLRENPFTNEEKQILIQKDGEAAWQAVEKNNFLAYGATLLAVLVTESFIVYIQLGDGDILQVDSQGNTTRPLERDPKLIANETTSLCMDKAWNEFQVHIKHYPQGSSKMPALIVMATDGYSNSFSSAEGFSKIGQDYRQMFKSNLIEEIGQQLKGFLQETSEKGSGDDITLGLIKRLEKDDQDYLEIRLTLDEEKVEFSMRQQKDITASENKVKRLDKHQKKKINW